MADPDLREKINDICGTNDRLALFLSGGDVRRYHQEGGHAYLQPVSEHTWRLLVIMLTLFPKVGRELIVTAIFHDVVERVTGDPPAPFKRAFPDVGALYDSIEKRVQHELDIPSEHDLTAEDFARLKVADYLELCITCRFQLERRPRQIYERGRFYVESYLKKLPKPEQVTVHEFLRKLHAGEWEA